MKILDFEVSEKTVQDIGFMDGDTYIITMRNPVTRYIEDHDADCYNEVWLCVLYDMSDFRLFLTDVLGEYEEIPWFPSERLMEQIEKFVA